MSFERAEATNPILKGRVGIGLYVHIRYLLHITRIECLTLSGGFRGDELLVFGVI